MLLHGLLVRQCQFLSILRVNIKIETDLNDCKYFPYKRNIEFYEIIRFHSSPNSRIYTFDEKKIKRI